MEAEAPKAKAKKETPPERVTPPSKEATSSKSNKVAPLKGKKQETPKEPEGPKYNLKGERYPIKSLLWTFLKT